MMKIYKDDIIKVIQSYGGISYYWKSLYKNFDEDDIITLSNSSKYFRYIPPMYLSYGKHIFHSSYYRFSINRNVRNLTTAHDFIYEHYQRSFKKKVHSFQKWLSLKHAHGIICISENTKKDLLKFYPEFKTKKIEVIYNGFNKLELFEKKPTAIKKSNLNYFLFIGDRTSYKKFDLTVELVANFKHDHLIFVSKDTLKKNELEKLNYKLNDRFTHLKHVSDAELKWLYINAKALIYASDLEGFGMPPLEASYQGCPVFCIKNLISVEIYGDIFPLCESTNFNEMCKFLKFISNKKSYINKSAIEKKFNWDNTFNKTKKFMEYIYEN